jgi:hypothetical protein
MVIPAHARPLILRPACAESSLSDLDRFIGVLHKQVGSQEGDIRFPTSSHAAPCRQSQDCPQGCGRGRMAIT